MFPGLMSFITRILRRDSNIPILLLTRRDEEIDPVLGQEFAGAFVGVVVLGLCVAGVGKRQLNLLTSEPLWGLLGIGSGSGLLAYGMEPLLLREISP